MNIIDIMTRLPLAEALGSIAKTIGEKLSKGDELTAQELALLSIIAGQAIKL